MEFTSKEIEKRNLNEKSKTGKDFLSKNQEKEIIAIVYADSLTTLYYDATGLDSEDRSELVRAICRELTYGCAYNREIIKQSNNIYFIY